MSDKRFQYDKGKVPAYNTQREYQEQAFATLLLTAGWESGYDKFGFEFDSTRPMIIQHGETGKIISWQVAYDYWLCSGELPRKEIV